MIFEDLFKKGKFPKVIKYCILPNREKKKGCFYYLDKGKCICSRECHQLNNKGCDQYMLRVIRRQYDSGHTY